MPHGSTTLDVCCNFKISCYTSTSLQLYRYVHSKSSLLPLIIVHFGSGTSFTKCKEKWAEKVNEIWFHFYILPPSTKNRAHLPFFAIHKKYSIFIYGKFSTNNNPTHHSTNTTSHLLFLFLSYFFFLLSYFTNSTLKSVSYTNYPIFCGRREY